MVHPLLPRRRVPPALIKRRAHPALHRLNDRLILPLESQATAYQHLLVVTKAPDGTLRTEKIAFVSFVPMTGEAREGRREGDRRTKITDDDALLDVRLEKAFRFGGIGLSLIGEVFNVFDDRLYTGYSGLIPFNSTNPNFGKPTNVVFGSGRRFQYGARVTF